MNWYKKAQSLNFYHGSFDKLPIGTILKPTPQKEYEIKWGGANSFYAITEKYRPPDKLPHYQSVFMCDNEDDVGLAGGAETYIYLVAPIGKVERHDVNWLSEIDCAVSDGKNEKYIENLAKKYWKGEPHFNESVWEYLTSSAKIIKLVYSEDENL